MKYIKLILIFVFPVFIAQAQQYIPFPAKDARWKQHIEYFYEEPKPHGSSITKQYKIERDTIIKSKTYHLLSFSEWQRTYDATKTETWSKYTQLYIGALREDSSKKVWFYDFKTGKDNLLYDFNQQEGLLKKTFLNNSDENQVVGIDSILLNGKHYRRLGIADKYGHTFEPFTYIIEGIGNINGLFTEIARQPEERTRLTCFSVNGEIIFRLNDSTDCSLVTSIIESKIEKINFNIYPNPSNGQFTIQTQSIFPESYICVRDVLGRIVHQEKLQFPNQNINISSQPIGLYFVELRDGKNKSIQKLILQ